MPRQPAAKDAGSTSAAFVVLLFYDFVLRWYRYHQRDGNSKPQFFNGRFLTKALLIDRIKEVAVPEQFL